MKKLLLILLFIAVQISITSCVSDKGKHLFILSGQSNMVRLDLNVSFIPSIEKEFGKDNVIVIKDAKGAQPISRWYKKAKANENETEIGDLYDRLLQKVNDSIAERKIQSVTFIWMQGERDARIKNAEVYEEYLLGLYDQLATDLNENNINFVIGRLSDFDMNNERWPHWIKIREIQQKVGGSNPRFDWVDTDEFNDGMNSKGDTIQNDLHMSVEGYKHLGETFAKKAIHLIKEN
jgi:hypothetical protein